MNNAVAIPSKERHESLACTLRYITSDAPVFVCDQSPQPFCSDRIQVLHAPTARGLPEARNILLQRISHQWLLFIDDDTSLSADFLVTLRMLEDQYPEIDAWGPVCETRPVLLRRLHRIAHLGCFADSRRLFSRRVTTRTRALYGCCFAVKRAAALAIHGFDQRRSGYALGEDYDFCLRLHAAGYKMAFHRDLRAIHRKDGENRADPDRRGADKVEFLWWIARRHGRANPATLVHFFWAVLCAASGRGDEPASKRGLWRGLCRCVLRS